MEIRPIAGLVALNLSATHLSSIPMIGNDRDHRHDPVVKAKSTDR